MPNSIPVDSGDSLPKRNFDRVRPGQIGQKGFTLLEMVLTIIILAIVGTIGAQLLSGGFSAYFTSQDLMTVTKQGEYAVQRMARELRSAQSCAGVTVTSGQISFKDSAGTNISFSQIAGTVVRSEGGVNRLLLENVVDRSLIFQNPAPGKPLCLVQIDFSLQKTLAAGGGQTTGLLPFQSSVFVRNP